ncbi:MULTISPECIES: tRNA uridine-5-carboxymethylaminomethyl(34) synthesis enzyme MnmG [Jonquetella]|uniref:tRNA uridine 5-carboxymethylaminomethyl modification enzyme MnmG n=1 Tax=Jonquetella anthropi DSM 22815 TaxID=885272 RepID=H0ULH7_9BACT|nr:MULTISPECIES: tRNA uridine-5-carboxymethylaminomethyl(34) synthesis enzyme MnmG [Jonquetella]EHM12442.1 glucose-inhibited division protein A [Jonquetella anthropi DSM 22815]ERL24854.1 tRNA uridine 5-carboxymethylaminomethyl modification enzyme GidA [Jonquetella sp. BV3C21]
MERITQPLGGFDVVVVGGGHAGCEAALAAARMGASVLLVAQDLSRVAFMPCNPSIGGPAKGHLVREISALGGEQARAADASAIMTRWLNTSKGAAVRALRCQCDLNDYGRYYFARLTETPGLELLQDEVTGLIYDDWAVLGVRTRFGLEIPAKRVILTTGTHLRGLIHVGLVNYPSGPVGQQASVRLADELAKMGLPTFRLKTGTPPRLHADSIDWSVLERQEGEDTPECFDFWGTPAVHKEAFCAVLRTNKETHRIVTDHLDESPIVQRVITGVGPRYCPSIESKVIAFPNKDSHPLFLEPVDRLGKEIYVQNFSTSLPASVQWPMVHSLPGCGRAKILKPGYAIEYDALNPLGLTPWLERKEVPGLFCAGQINGTSGYEEAAAQGLLAGINAVLSLRGEEPLVLGRHEAYLGVLVDDLVTKGTDEPYRMLTSRCEYRLLLRHDNADRRLAAKGAALGLVSQSKWDELRHRWDREDREFDRLGSLKLTAQQVDGVLTACQSRPTGQGMTAAALLRRPEVTYQALAAVGAGELTGDEADAVAVRVKYEGYVKRQELAAQSMLRLEGLEIPQDFDFKLLNGALSESVEKLERVRPRTLGQASRISGVTPADLQHLAMILRSGVAGHAKP